MKKDYKQKGTANPLKQGQVKAWLIVLLSVFCTCVSFAQMPTIRQGPWAKGVKVSNQAIYLGEDESNYYFFDYFSKITLLGFDKTDLSLKTEKEFKVKMSMRLLIYGGIFGENIEVLTVKHEAKGYRLEKLTFKKSDLSLTSTEDVGFSPFEDGKTHFGNMDPVKLKDMLTVSSKTSTDQSHRALVRLDQCKNGAPSTWKIAVLDNTTNATLWSRDTDFHFHDYVITNDGKVILVGFTLADTDDKVTATLMVMSGEGEDPMSFELPANIGSAELVLSGNRLFVTGSLKGETYGKKGLFWEDVSLCGMYVTLLDMNEQVVVASDEYPFTKEDIDVYCNEKGGKSKENKTKWIHFYPHLMNDGRICVMSEYAYRIVSNSPTSGIGGITSGINSNTGNYYYFGRKGCFLSMFDAEGKLQWRKPYKNEIVNSMEVVAHDLFDINGNLCYYSMVCSKYKYPSDVAASQDPRLLQTKLREIILDNDGNETVNVIDGKGVVGIAAQSYNSDKTKRVFWLIEQGLLKSDVRVVVVE
jgi:hypothetical protein